MRRRIQLMYSLPPSSPSIVFQSAEPTVSITAAPLASGSLLSVAAADTERISTPFFGLAGQKLASTSGLCIGPIRELPIHPHHHSGGRKSNSPLTARLSCYCVSALIFRVVGMSGLYVLLFFNTFSLCD